jgi:biopolymer transport protein ExbD
MALASADNQPITGINVTPLVDVMLVLLIIFMATSSYIVNPAIEVDLPEAASGGDVVESTIALVLSRDGKLFLNGNAVSEQQIADHCKQASAQNPQIQAIIAADGASVHRDVVRLIDLVKLNGVSSFALNIEVPETATPTNH